MRENTSTFLYCGNAGTRDISAFSVHDGHLQPIDTFPVPGPADACFSSPLAVSPDKNFLFFALRNQPWSVRSFAIDAESGRLRDIGAGPLADNICYMSTDHSGRFLLSASYQGAKISVNPIRSDGIVEAPIQVIDTDPKSHCIRIDATQRFAFSSCLETGKVYQWIFDDRTGLLTPNNPPFVSAPANSGPRHFVFHPNGSHVYLLNELAGSVCTFELDRRRGVLTLVQELGVWTAPTGEKVSAADIQIAPSGRFLYASTRGVSELATLRINLQDGKLALIDKIPTEPSPRGFAIDPDGGHLYAVGQLSNRLSAYSINSSDGSLKQIAVYPVGKTPNWIEVVKMR